MTNSGRTHDASLRRARRDKLVAAARAGAASLDGTGVDVLVTGSLARGQTHPWSDLDLLLRSRDGRYDRAYEMSLKVLRAVEGTGLWEVDVVPEESVQPALIPGMIGGARSVYDIPELAELPDPDLAQLRAAQSLEFACSRARKMLEEVRNMPDSGEILRRATPAVILTQLSYKAALAVKRLAVFQDDGRSAFLDGDRSEPVVQELLDRLSDPFERPAMLTEDVKSPLLWLLTGEDRDNTRVDATLDALEGWIPHLRSTTEQTDTHGLSL